MIRLRPYKACDAERLIGWIPEDTLKFEMWCAGHFEFPITPEQLEDYRLMYEHDSSAWSMTAVDDFGDPVGHLLMRLCDFQNGHIHFGFIIVDPEKRGIGLGCEMLKTALRYCSEILGMKSVTLGVFEKNPAAHRCYLKAGFHDEGISDKKEIFNGESLEIILMRADI